MDQLFESLAADPWGRLVLHQLSSGGLWQSYLTMLVASRLSGVLIIAPCFQPRMVPLMARVSLVILLSVIVGPILSADGTTNTELVQVAHASGTIVGLPATVTDLICTLANEVAIGILFGMGLIAVFQGFRFAGELLDRHTGFGLGSVLNPESSTQDSPCGSITLWLGGVAILVAEPIAGHWQLFRVFVQSFHEIPIGQVSWSNSATELMAGLVQQSLLLGLRIAMPLIASMLLIDVSLAFAMRGSSPTLAPALHVARTALALLILALSVTSIPDVVAVAIQAVGQSFAGSN